jgi:RNA polymerase sigma-70 factor (ECF subfamily)
VSGESEPTVRPRARPVDPAAGAVIADGPSDLELLESLDDDPNALGLLYDRHASLVYGLAMSVLRDATEAEDLTQEVFVGLTEHSFDPERGTLAAYLVSLTRSRAIDRLRRGGRHLRLLRQWHESEPEPPSAPTPHQAISDKQLGQRVRAALADLSEREREVLELSYYRGLTQAEIADELGAPLGSVKSWARRALLSLRDNLQDLV